MLLMSPITPLGSQPFRSNSSYSKGLQNPRQKLVDFLIFKLAGNLWPPTSSPSDPSVSSAIINPARVLTGAQLCPVKKYSNFCESCV